jgi:zinc protease
MGGAYIPRPCEWWRRRLAVAIVALLLLPTARGWGQDLAAPLPLDPAIRTGTLPNGLTFFIRKNARPEKRVLLRLAVKAGSIDEADDQRGLAHMLEHMAFNGSAHFKAGELVSYLESVGARFGPHVNAYTSYDETVYMLDLPTDRDGVVRRGFEALSDFGGRATLDTKEIDKERGVVIEEWRGRLGAGTRMQQPQMAALFGKSRYTDRIPIGTPETLRTFKPDRLREFYRKYYRPDRMAVVVVGDIDPMAMEALVREHFGTLRARGKGARPASPIPPHADTRYVSVSDPEAQGSSVSIIHKHPMQTLRTAAEYRQSLVRGLMHQMLGARFAEIARRPDAPFLRAGSGDDEFGRTVEAFSVSARVQDGGIDKGLAALAEELSRVRMHGFGEAELERAKRSTLAAYERAYNERDKSESGGYASELISYFLAGDAAPGIETELQLARKFIPTITAQEIGTLARQLVADHDRVVLATSPQKDGLAPATEAALRAALKSGEDTPVTAWRDEVSAKELMAKAPTPGTITSRREIPELGVTVLSLSNGVEVWLKPTDFRNDQVIFTSYARGGTATASREDYLDATFSTSLIGIAGVGGFTPVELGKLLAGRIASASPYMSDYTDGVSGSSTPKDLEVALQLTHLFFTAPNTDPTAIDLMRRRLQANIANRDQSPGSVFGDRVRSINTLDHYTAKPLRAEDIAKLNPERMQAIYKQRFANAANFTFFFVGAFKVDDVAPLLATYLGSLPSKGSRDAQTGQLHLQFPAAVQRETVNKGREPRSQTIISFFANTGLEELEVHRLRAATGVLQNRLRDILREELGGTYSVGVGYSDTSPEPGYGTTSVQFGSSPDNVEKLTSAVMTELDRLRREGPTAADVDKAKQAEKNDLQTSLRQNGYWLNSLQTMHLLGRDPLRINQRMERADSLSVENVHAAFKKYFPAERYTVVTLMPESTAQRTASAK